ncbi:hypothetical protein [Salinivibrio socompensis]|uniref:hypothetical protein n=1 Tax=Salinivibrio socompensis TaxID=1510206 RepID=UPI0004B16D78|nr:hypothetical protein [Salinivibrio socompensis]
MRFTQPIEALEAQDEALRKQVNGLTQSQKKRYFAEQARQLKDPDTYAALNWAVLRGISSSLLAKVPVVYRRMYIIGNRHYWRSDESAVFRSDFGWLSAI